MKRKAASLLPSGYRELLTAIKARVRTAQVRAGLAANRELLSLYWDIGRMILDRQEAEGWGTKVNDRLSRDLQNEFPGQQGFSPRNLKYMRAFAEAWPQATCMYQPNAKMPQAKSAIVQQPVAQLPWGHHTILLNKLDTVGDRLWYAARTIEHGWSRNVPALQIDSAHHFRQGTGHYPQVLLLDTGAVLAAREDRCFAVPKGQSRIAQRFNAGLEAKMSQVPKGRLRSNPRQQPSAVPSGLVCHAELFPALKRRAILKMSLRDKGRSRLLIPPGKQPYSLAIPSNPFQGHGVQPGRCGTHSGQGKGVKNFQGTLPPPHSDLAQQITKDAYVFDFLNLRDDANERAVEQGLPLHVEKFLLELGVGFALVGRQVHMDVGDQDFYLDLLFYHFRLRCFIVVDLKARDFMPEAAGKMNFYLSAVDDRFRQLGDQPSIGLILCRAKNRIIAEYALRDLQKPIGISGYVTRLVGSLPKELQASVPSVEEIESGLAPASETIRPRKTKKP